MFVRFNFVVNPYPRCSIPIYDLGLPVSECSIFFSIPIYPLTPHLTLTVTHQHSDWFITPRYWIVLPFVMNLSTG